MEREKSCFLSPKKGGKKQHFRRWGVYLLGKNTKRLKFTFLIFFLDFFYCLPQHAQIHRFLQQQDTEHHVMLSIIQITAKAAPMPPQAPAAVFKSALCCGLKVVLI